MVLINSSCFSRQNGLAGRKLTNVNRRRIWNLFGKMNVTIYSGNFFDPQKRIDLSVSIDLFG